MHVRRSYTNTLMHRPTSPNATTLQPVSAASLTLIHVLTVDTIPSVLDPRYKDQLFKGLMAKFFETAWVDACAEAMVETLTLDYADPLPDLSMASMNGAPNIDRSLSQHAGGFSFANSSLLGSSKRSSPASEDCAAQLRRYLGEDLLGPQGDILQWWKANEHRFPALARMAKAYLAIPGEYFLSLKILTRPRLIDSFHRYISKRGTCSQWWP
jgi:hypothetical protein